MSSLRVTLLELPAAWNEPARQLARVEEALSKTPPGDLVLLPEASLTGYLAPDLSSDLSRFAEPLAGRTAQALAHLAAQFRCAMVGPLIERDGRKLYNTILGFGPDGARILHYRKRHPWYPELWASPGTLPYPQLEIAGVKVAAAICFDVHFLEEEAAGMLEAADVLLFPSAWVDEADARPAQLGAMAAKHRVSIANANWGPGRPKVPGQGGSMAVDAAGKIVARAAEGETRLDVTLQSK